MSESSRPRPSRRSLLKASTATVAGTLVAAPAAAHADPGGPVDAVGGAPGPGDALGRGVWLAGDTHVHTDHSADGSATRQGSGQVLPGNVAIPDQINQGLRSGLTWMPVTDHRTYDQVWDPLFSSSALLLVPGEEANGSPHAIALGCIDEVVDGAHVPGSHDYRHIQQSIWEVHAQGGVWSTAHPDDGEFDAGTGTRVTNGNAEAVGVHLIEVWNRASLVDVEIDYAENRWNAGWRTGGVGGCDCHFREVWAYAGPGNPTTHVFASELSERAILQALRAGRTSINGRATSAFLTLEADLDGDGAFEVVGGDEITGLTVGRAGVLRVRVQSGTGMSLQVLQAPGRSTTPLLAASITSPDQTWLVPVTVAEGAGWWRAEVRGTGEPASIDTGSLQSGDVSGITVADQLQAFVSPIFTSTGAPGQPLQALALPTPAADGTDDFLAGVGERGDFTSFPDVAVADRAGAGDRTVHVVAERHLDGGTAIVYRGAPTWPAAAAEQVVASSGFARLPRVAASGDIVHVVWQDERTGQLPRAADIWLRTSLDGGRSWQPETRVSRSPGRSERPAIAVDPADPLRPWIAWTDNQSLADTTTTALPGAGAAAFDVMVARPGETPVNLSAAGKATSLGTPGDTRSPRWPASLHPSVTVGPAGDVAVCWQDNRFDPHPLWTGSTPPPGTTSGPSQNVANTWEPMVAVHHLGTWSPPLRVAPDATESARHPQAAFDPAGRLVIAWSSKKLPQSDVNLRLLAATSADRGSTWSAPGAVDAFDAAMQARPRLGVDPDGVLRVVWADTRHADWRWRIRSARLEEDGWQPGGFLSQVGNGTYPVTAGGVVALASDRNARPQRDVTEQVLVLDLRPAAAGMALPEGAPLALATAGLAAAGAVASRRAGRRSGAVAAGAVSD